METERERERSLSCGGKCQFEIQEELQESAGSHPRLSWISKGHGRSMKDTEGKKRYVRSWSGGEWCPILGKLFETQTRSFTIWVDCLFFRTPYGLSAHAVSWTCGRGRDLTTDQTSDTLSPENTTSIFNHQPVHLWVIWC